MSDKQIQKCENEFHKVDQNDEHQKKQNCLEHFCSESTEYLHASFSDRMIWFLGYERGHFFKNVKVVFYKNDRE